MAKILLVEDDNNLREIYEARLQAEGYDIVTAHDGEEALVVAKSETPDLIISDVMMPKISGFEMLDILRNTEGLKDVKIIMLTALGQSDDQQRADRLGANRYLVKSQVTLEDIVTVAQGLLAADDTSTPLVTAEPAAAPAPPDASAADPIAVVSPSLVSEPETAPVTVPPEPIAPAPASFEAVAPEIAVATPPSPILDPASSPVANDAPAAGQLTPLSAQLIAEEEANVEAQIEDFVQGATTEASPTSITGAVAAEPVIAIPTAPVEVSPTSPVTTDTAPDTDPSPNAVADDKLISDALTTFNENAAANQPTPALAPSEAPIPGSSAIVVSPGLPVLKIPDEPTIPIDGVSPQAKSENEATESDTQAIVARKKVISPLNSTAKPDLATLLAREAANEARPDTIIAPTTMPPSDSSPDQPRSIDPNSIAL